MTYLQFHLVFILPPILLLAWFLRKKLVDETWRRPLRALAGMMLVAFIYTTAWDNYLVWKGVWGYGADRVLLTIGYVPLSEYLFFLLQPVLTGLWFYGLIAWRPARGRQATRTARWAGLAVGLGLTVVGIICLYSDSTLYFGLILAWAGPVLAGQWWLSGRLFWMYRRHWLAGVAVPTLYLWIADRTAIGLGIWYVSDRYTTGLELAGLPAEEATFFLVTNLMVVQGLMMFTGENHLRKLENHETLRTG